MSLRILVLDEDPALREMYRELLEDNGYDFTITENRFEAQRVLEHGKEQEKKPYTLMISDCGNGPAKNRATDLVWVKDYYPEVQIILATDRPELLPYVNHLTIYYFRKPFQVKILLERIKEIEKESI